MNIFNRIIILLGLLALISCKTTNPQTRQAKVVEMAEKLKSKNYTFEARIAYPMSAKVMPLSSSYTLQVKPDTIIAYLPYFGRAYSAPDPLEGGIKFTSTDFEYKISEQDKGMSTVSIEIKDHKNQYKLSLLVGELGKTTLYVNQTSKQSISFTGDIY